ncbi:cell division protein FtsL [Modicisalibacter tunisiensis]|uniref:Cell division protein FtsL n=1 Tax=Modicisalibacter tunisiensis TaxID=390637 RepID=A0ABS7WZS0_9GAMM|nr:cell division protein FtsL [Modicisalibacter tunisiensis]KXS38828.1 MAG: cell division protein FtsL [Halomonadaceae bacterium T82-2]MBZ9538452.1 cell division protein FtsL [Modicisalibacter tunisiensis]MBZ9568135.1 cell division protein FtsL [Modicisalibacter tunisiensis]
MASTSPDTPRTQPRRRWRLQWRLWLVGLLIVLILGSALAVIASAHRTRVQYARLQRLEAQQDKLQTAWGRLLLEESTWSAPSRIERLAAERLDMQVPDISQVKVIQP